MGLFTHTKIAWSTPPLLKEKKKERKKKIDTDLKAENMKKHHNHFDLEPVYLGIYKGEKVLWNEMEIKEYSTCSLQ